MKIIALIVLLFLTCALGRDDFTMNFIQSFIENESKSTMLIFVDLCWGKRTRNLSDVEVNLVNLMSKVGIRTSSSTSQKASYQDQDLLFLADMECSETDDALAEATSKKLFQFPFRWLVLSNPNHVNITKSTIWSCPLLLSSDVVLAERNGDYNIIMTELYKPSYNHSMLSTPRGFYNGSFFDTRPHRELFRRRRDLMGEPLVMSNVIQDNNRSKEHLLKEDRLDLQNDAVPKACWVAAKAALEMLNATMKYIFSYRWGYKVNGEWSGMIADINSEKADIATNCVMFMDRLAVVTYTDSVAPLRMRFVFRQPPLTYTSNIFALPFSSNVWVALVVCSASATLALVVTSMWEVHLEKNPSQLDGSVSDALLLTMSALAQQGCFIEPRRAPGRIIEWFFFAALMALYAAYSANIVVLLQAQSNSIRSLNHLADSKIALGALDVDYNHFVFSSQNDSVHLEIRKRVMPEGGASNFYPIDKGVEKIRQGLFAFHSVTEPVYRRIEDTFLENEKCDLSEADFVNGFDGFIPMKKDSPYLEVVRVVYKQIREYGIQDAIAKRFLVFKPRCGNRMFTFSSVGLLDMRPVLMFMLYGVACSVLIFAAEVGYYKFFKLTTIKKDMKSRVKNALFWIK